MVCEGRETCRLSSSWLTDPFLGFRGQDLETQPRPGVCLTLKSQDSISAFLADDGLLSASMVGDLQRTLGKFAAELGAAVIRINLKL